MNAAQIGTRLGNMYKQAGYSLPAGHPGVGQTTSPLVAGVQGFGQGAVAGAKTIPPAISRGFNWTRGKLGLSNERIGEAAKSWPVVRDALKNPLDTLTSVVHGGMNQAIGPSASPTAYYRSPK